MLSRLNFALNKQMNRQSTLLSRAASQFNFSTDAAASEPHFKAHSVEDGIVMFDMNRPKSRNALSRQLVDEFMQAISDHQKDARCVILRSSVKGMFCAGADLKERKGMSDQEVKDFLTKMRKTFTMFSQMACPTISVVDGPALGGGLELSLCSDMRVSTEQAIFGLPETGLAIIPGAGGTQRLARLIGISRAKELIFTGDRLTPEQALDIGLVNHVEADYDAAVEKALGIAKKIGSKGPIAIRAAKKAVHFGIDMDLESGLQHEQDCYQMVINTEDRLEGLRAFAEKRAPVFKGK